MGRSAQCSTRPSADLSAIASLAKPDPIVLADRVGVLLEEDHREVLVDLVVTLAPGLDQAGLTVLRAALAARAKAQRRPKPAFRAAAQLLADAQGDIEGYIATFSTSELAQPGAGAEIARRLLATGRTEDALAALARSEPPKAGRVLLPGVQAWETVFLEALEADGQGELAQELRWTAFEKRLAVDRLRAFLKRLPDFDDIQAEDRAMAHARLYPNFSDALAFFTAWPTPVRAADLILARRAEIDPGQVELLEAASAMLEARHPLAASLLLRAMVADILRDAQIHRYKEAERLLDALEALTIHIDDWAEVEPHHDFMTRLARLRRL